MMRRMLDGPLACPVAGLLPGLAMLLVATAVAAQPAQQPPTGQRNALQGFSQNRDQPVKINANTLEVRDKKKVATYTGNVVLVQGDTTLRCKTLVVYYDNDQSTGTPVKAATPGPAGSDQIRRIDAIGSVIVTQKDQTATGEKAIYDIKDDTVRLFPAPGGYVAVTQGQNVVRGPILIVHLDTGISHFEGNGSQPVESLFVPSSKNDNHAAPPAAPAAPLHPAPHATPRSRTDNPTGLY